MVVSTVEPVAADLWCLSLQGPDLEPVEGEREENWRQVGGSFKIKWENNWQKKGGRTNQDNPDDHNDYMIADW